ncbi:uncharacterized protein CANTADRAFT_53506 [Suhomyces tanzawaensis NRRL Y-17324]|uniref:Uncharacterized protein n=1 Tax=Suhomyces tanzawaensis NRRL Y-17324 TaxID=984487 RepID=A0A1E4SGQ3_9ASCO|nr:uncharacterized protein CANTADRAFT_53506 [Suhomyces tanzawaensis NRRL Y-17324]ODV78666.1 hypothetical protein CANTADRAFT_53506 [Suhomyces tanzawaensis NRRL Y-17324]
MIGLTRQIAKTGVRGYSTVATSGARKVGTFRGGFLGFLLGVTVTGAGSYYYLIDEYKVANNVIVADVVALQNSINNLEKHVKSLESKK